MQKGKQLEKEVRGYLKKRQVFFHKFTDSFASRGFVTPVPSDFIIFSPKGPTILLECKETHKPLLPLTAFRPSQWAAMKESMKVDSCSYYVVILYDNKYLLLEADAMLEALNSGDKSIDLSYGIIRFPTINEVMEFMINENRGLYK